MNLDLIIDIATKLNTLYFHSLSKHLRFSSLNYICIKQAKPLCLVLISFV